MTVKELSNILQACPDDGIIYLSMDNGYNEREYSETSKISVYIQDSEIWIDGEVE